MCLCWEWNEVRFLVLVVKGLLYYDGNNMIGYNFVVEVYDMVKLEDVLSVIVEIFNCCSCFYRWYDGYLEVIILVVYLFDG